MIPKPIITPKEAVALIKAGDSVMCGGFMGCGAAETIARAAAEHCPHHDLTLMSSDHSWCNPDRTKINGIAPMILAKLFKKAYSSHIGLNDESQKQMREGTMDVTLLPQGTFVERIRAAGAGLGGILTPTGVGTEVQDGKKVMEIDGKKYLLELPMRGDIAFIKAKKADKGGNLVYSKTARNFNPAIATAAAIVVAEVEEIVEIGALDPEEVVTPFIFVDYLVLAGGK